MPTTTTTPLDRLYANLGGIIKDALFPKLHGLVLIDTVSDKKLAKLAEALYLEVVAEYQPEPGIYGLADDGDVEEEWTMDAWTPEETSHE